MHAQPFYASAAIKRHQLREELANQDPLTRALKASSPCILSPLTPLRLKRRSHANRCASVPPKVRSLSFEQL